MNALAVHIVLIAILSSAVDGQSAQLLAEDTVLTLSDVVRANQQATALIDQIELTMRHRRQLFVGAQASADPFEEEWKWARDRHRERVQYALEVEYTPDGRPDGLYDWFLADGELHLLRNWDAANPQAITPLMQGTLYASIHPATRKAPGRNVTRFLLWTFSLDDADNRWSLQELVDASPRVEFAGPVELDGHSLYRITAAHPGVDGISKEGSSFEVFVDPTVNYNVRRVVERHVNTRTVGDHTEVYELQTTRSVIQFADYGDGIHVPTHMHATLLAADSHRTEIDSRVSIHHVNESLSEAALDFKFPEHARVHFGPALSPDTQRVAIWGSDNRPAVVINNTAEMAEFEAAALSEFPLPDSLSSGNVPEAKDEGNPNWLLWVNVLILALLAVYLFRQRASRADSKGAPKTSQP